MSRRSLLSSLTVLAISLAGVPAADAARYEFGVSPRVGTPSTAFVVSFLAPRAADGQSTEYFVEAIGPPRCAQLFEFGGIAVRGQRERLRLTAGDDVVHPGPRRRWCRGTYVGVVTWSDRDSNADDVYIGYLKFRVR